MERTLAFEAINPKQTLKVWIEATVYMWNSFVYVGKEKNVSEEESWLMKELGISGSVVPISELS